MTNGYFGGAQALSDSSSVLMDPPDAAANGRAAIPCAADAARPFRSKDPR